MYRVKIYGAGSIGNHLAHASRQLNWEVVVCDVSDAALERMRKEIYPHRYGHWDTAIQLYNNESAPVGGFDFIFIGTPPVSHMPLALQAVQENPKVLLIEKPLCLPSLDLAQELFHISITLDTKVFAGYDHVVGKAVREAEELIRSGVIGNVQTIDVEFREHWGGIFEAHHWLKGPEDSYLGFWELGGGACGEHSHAANLWQHFAHVAGAGRVVEVDAMMNYVTDGKTNYDNLCLLTLRTEGGLVGRVVQDVVMLPHSKRARIQGTKGTLEWVIGYDPEGDALLCSRLDAPGKVQHFPKKRPDDFIQELKHLEAQMAGVDEPSGIRLERGLDTMLVVSAAHRSESEKCRVQIDYSKGYTLDALRPCRS